MGVVFPLIVSFIPPPPFFFPLEIPTSSVIPETFAWCFDQVYSFLFLVPSGTWVSWSWRDVLHNGRPGLQVTLEVVSFTAYSNDSPSCVFLHFCPGLLSVALLHYHGCSVPWDSPFSFIHVLRSLLIGQDVLHRPGLLGRKSTVAGVGAYLGGCYGASYGSILWIPSCYAYALVIGGSGAGSHISRAQHAGWFSSRLAGRFPM